MASGTKPPSCARWTDDELVDKLREAKEELFNLRFQAATGQLESHGRLRAVRTDIARIYTIMRERELGISTVEGDRRGCGMSETEGAARQRRPRRRADSARPARVSSSATRWTRPSSSPSRTASSTRSTARSSAARASSRRTTRPTPPASATGSCSWRPGRCRRRKRWRVVEILEKAK